MQQQSALINNGTGKEEVRSRWVIERHLDGIWHGAAARRSSAAGGHNFPVVLIEIIVRAWDERGASSAEKLFGNWLLCNSNLVLHL